MTEAEKLIKTIKIWAGEQEDICGVILIGSYAQKKKVDQLSDIDLCFFTTQPEKYQQEDDWLQTFAPFWFSINQEKNKVNVWETIFEPGILVEFFIYPSEAIQTFSEQLPPSFNPGFTILVEKGKCFKQLPKPSGKIQPPEAPSAALYQKAVKAFWFNALFVAKYLWRGELWRAKHYDWKIKQILLQMMGWHALICGGRTNFTTYEGKGFQSWVSPEIYTDIMTSFGRFYPADSWRALDITIQLFSNLSKEVADTLNTDAMLAIGTKVLPMIEDMKLNRSP